MAGYKPKLYITGQLTTVDGTLVEATISVPFPAPAYNQFAKSGMAIYALHLKSLAVELAGGTNILDTAADIYCITISPNSQVAHPVITDGDALFKFKRYCTLATGAATGPQGIMNLLNKWSLKDCYINKTQFYLQCTLNATGQILYYKIEYEIVRMGMAQANYEAQRSMYATT